MRIRLPRRLLPWLFALALLIGQAAAFAHSFTHVHDPALPDHVCEICVAQAHLGGAAPAPLITPAIESVRHHGPTCAEVPAYGAGRRAALARAPPTAH